MGVLCSRGGILSHDGPRVSEVWIDAVGGAGGGAGGGQSIVELIGRPVGGNPRAVAVGMRVRDSSTDS